jgi:hypothetical protein
MKKVAPWFILRHWSCSGQFPQGATKSIQGALVLLRQTNPNARPIGMRWVRPTNINALREHRCRELRCGSAK